MFAPDRIAPRKAVILPGDFVLLKNCPHVHIARQSTIPILHLIVKYWNKRRLQRIRERTQRRQQAVAVQYAESELRKHTYTRGDTEKNIGLMLDALGLAARRELLRRLQREGAMSLSKLGQPFHMKLPRLHKQILILERSGLVTTHKRGRVRICVYNRAALEELAAWLISRRR
ncbi:hypothetical protein A2763_01315 [Candidatus Kaiserbacteria bacterium RIFCSPHIGHO2_01_FULL_54_36]|uniref:HTH arsR-type domain-containing protein n=1 Tax=Candidatus Kaiserbacteria bacterium RIFCSPHIGHO2_01_FULL_54_36 TaxID=1798482 RepID=A0A1F6CME0_9BACT|nr:MAG: hypothetical protein A2763_01315 [Candidatus Kaiserbacteria bacterium RIFCSPHIGHO2_01_FULL_54_36]OGG75757.1 MAG: hypothetical protein A3A41_00085 [Candidatus Kaiserbacteria bacterium RIFCSPLOWO2_01_FULL_54_22]